MTHDAPYAPVPATEPPPSTYQIAPPSQHEGVPLDGPAAADYIDPPAAEQPLALVDGQPVRLKYGLRALRQLEAKFGSVPHAFRLIDQAAKAMQDPDLSAGQRADVFTVVTDAVIPGLSHVMVASRSGVTDAAGRVRLSDDPDRALDVLDDVPLNRLIAALQEALSSSFGTLVGSSGNGPAPVAPQAPALTQTHSSPGATGTGSPSSTWDAPTPSSGT